VISALAIIGTFFRRAPSKEEYRLKMQYETNESREAYAEIEYVKRWKLLWRARSSIRRLNSGEIFHRCPLSTQSSHLVLPAFSAQAENTHQTLIYS
jgi:hypothetical protein